MCTFSAYYYIAFFDKATQTDRQIIIIVIIMKTIYIAPKNRMNGTYMTEQKVNKSV